MVLARQLVERVNLSLDTNAESFITTYNDVYHKEACPSSLDDHAIPWSPLSERALNPLCLVLLYCDFDDPAPASC